MTRQWLIHPLWSRKLSSRSSSLFAHGSQRVLVHVVSLITVIRASNRVARQYGCRGTRIRGIAALFLLR